MRKFIWTLSLVVLLFAGWLVIKNIQNHYGSTEKKQATGPIPVEVQTVKQESIELRRTFNGTLESPARLILAPKVSGRVLHLSVDLADEVSNGQVVAELDSEEFEQAELQAQAELEVSKANLVEAQSNLEVSEREMGRVTSLQDQGIATDAQVDSARAQLSTRKASLEVAKAQVSRAEAALEGARIRLGYTRVSVNWNGSGRRFVAQRNVNEGEIVNANTPLFTIVELDPIKAVVYVTEKDYGLIQVGQTADIKCDAFPEKSFKGAISRFAPVFNRDSRQARVEILLKNPDGLLKPGMFVNAEIVLGKADQALTMPISALATRNDQEGVFVINDSGSIVSWLLVETGIKEGNRIQVKGLTAGQKVVTMGQQMLEDGSVVVLPDVDLPEKNEGQ